MRPFAQAIRVSLLLLSLGVSLSAAAQGHGGGGPGGPPPPPPGGGFGGPGGPPPGGGPGGESRQPQSGGGGDNHGGLQLGPSGRWWDDTRFAKVLKIDSNQQHRMDGVFNANKNTLVNLYKAVQREDKQLSKISRVKNPDEVAIDQQIDRVTQARGELQKAEAHMLLEVRKELSPEQIAKLEDYMPPPE